MPINKRKKRKSRLNSERRSKPDFGTIKLVLPFFFEDDIKLNFQLL